MQLPRDEQLALDHAVGKLAAIGPALPYPHQSAVKAKHLLRSPVRNFDGKALVADPGYGQNFW